MTASPDHAGLALFGVFYGIYAWVVGIACVLAAILGTLVLPGLLRRRHWVSACARAIFRLAGIRVVVRGMEKLPDGHCIVVANHASYLDGVVAQGFLPARFSYVIKSEVRRWPLIGFFLRRIDAKFVERFDASGSARDARQLLSAASAGESLAFFPEGTFVPEAGLDRFRAGAFAAAIKGCLPIVPLVISGSRQIWRGGTILPRHGDLRLDFMNPIEPGHPAFENNKTLADAARQSILEVLDEPDLLVDSRD